jgi:hypothetical protein
MKITDLMYITQAIHSLSPFAVVTQVTKDPHIADTYTLHISELEWNPVDRWTVINWTLETHLLSTDSSGEETKVPYHSYAEAVEYFKRISPDSWWIELPETAALQALLAFDPYVVMGDDLQGDVQ